MDIEGRVPYTFREVYDDVFPVLLKVVFHIVRDMGAAEDLCQEAFLRYYNRRIPIPSIAESRYWLIRVAKNLAFNYRKRKGRESSAVDRIKLESQYVQPDSQDDLVREEDKVIIRDAVDSLPVKYRSVLVLKEYGELNYKEIAKILHISENNVKIRVYRARVLLEKKLSIGDFHVF